MTYFCQPINLLFITDGTMLIGCSELTGRYWNGSVGVFESVIEGQKLHREQKNSITITSGTADGCFIERSSKVMYSNLCF